MSETLSVYLSGVDSTNYSYSTVSNTANSYNSLDDDTYCRLALKTGANAISYRYFKFNLDDLPTNATILSVSAKVKASTSAQSNTYVTEAIAQLATGLTLKGDSCNIKHATASVQNISNPGNWTKEELEDARMYFQATRGTQKTTSTIYIYIYGAELTVTYSIPPQNFLYIKNNGFWAPITQAYKKINGIWVEETDLTQVFDSNNTYIQGIS